MLLELGDLGAGPNYGKRALRRWGRGIGFHQSWEQESGWRNALSGVDAAAARAKKHHGGNASEPQHFPNGSHLNRI